MSPPPTFDDLSPAIRAALEGRGFTELTPVQEAVLDPALAGRDLRIFSQTGSGKTVAVGLAIAPDLARAATAAPVPSPAARPFALVVAPTRELAAQIAAELGWLFAPAGVVAVTGGQSYARELSALRRGPSLVVGTPGRLLDHLARRSLDPSSIGALVLDEADQMLDMGFREELDAILAQVPETRRTILLSATFPREVRRLADRCQKDPAVAAAEGAGEANVDIAHVAHLVLPEERDRALVNLLLTAPGERALVFVRTREGASELADRLMGAGLPARAIHGDLEQWERTRTLDAFRSGAVSTLVATDVAARGLDVPDVYHVIHADPPGDAEVFTHRSGRTGRAGKKGTSVVLVPPAMRERVRSMFRRAGVEAVWAPAPSAGEVLRAADERLAAELAAGEGPAPEPRLRLLAERLLETMDPAELVSALLARAVHAGPCAPMEVTPILPPAPRPERAPHTSPPPAPSSFAPFRINWGERHGADPRRLLALVCRRGGIRGNQVGAIRIGSTSSTFEVDAAAAADFGRAVKKPDARDPRIRIEPAGQPPAEGRAAHPRAGRTSPRPQGRPEQHARPGMNSRATRTKSSGLRG